MIFGPPNQEPRLEDLSLLLGHTCDPQTCMSEAHLRPSQLNLGPFKVTPTTLKPACQEPAYDPHSSTYDPSRSHLRPSNLHVRSPPTTLTAPPTTLQGHTYDPQTCMSGSQDDPFRTLAEYKGITQSASKEEGTTQILPRSCFSVVWRSHCQSAECSQRLSFQLRFELRFLLLYHR